MSQWGVAKSEITSGIETSTLRALREDGVFPLSTGSSRTSLNFQTRCQTCDLHVTTAATPSKHLVFFLVQSFWHLGSKLEDVLEVPDETVHTPSLLNALSGGALIWKAGLQLLLAVPLLMMSPPNS